MREDPNEIRRLYVLERGSALTGTLSLGHSRPGSPEHPSSKHLLWARATVLPEFRRQGLARSWLARVADVMDEVGATTCTTYVELEAGHGFMRSIGGRQVFSGAENRLDLARLDRGLLEEWSQIDAGFRLELHEPRLPEALFDAFCPAYTAMGRGVPMEDMDHGEWITTPERIRDNYARLDVEGGAHHLLLAYEGVEIVGVTEYLQRPYAPQLIHQELTATDPRVRGRGLGKQLKSVLLLHVLQLYPSLRWVVTENAGSNAPMLSINRRMGFRTHVAGHGYQLTREELGVAL